MKIAGKEYKEIGKIWSSQAGAYVPLLDFRMSDMTVEEENRQAEELAMRVYRRMFGEEPENPRAALERVKRDLDECERIDELMATKNLCFKGGKE